MLVVLTATLATARERHPLVRNVYLADNPKDEAEQVRVAADLVTVLRFQHPCDPARTRLLGWEGRFEPVACVGKSVLLVPLQRLEPEDRFMLLVTLADGKALPFTVRGSGSGAGDRPDQQVNVFLRAENPEALRMQLEDIRAWAAHLEQANLRHWREDTIDHALAGLLAKGALRQTPFIEREKRLVRVNGAEIVVRIYSGKAKAAAVFTVTNRDPAKPWNLLEARLVATRPGEDLRAPYMPGEARPFALRTDREELAPGESGNVAVVVDRCAFETERGLANLALEIYRHDGLREAYVLLDWRLTK